MCIWWRGKLEGGGGKGGKEIGTLTSIHIARSVIVVVVSGIGAKCMSTVAVYCSLFVNTIRVHATYDVTSTLFCSMHAYLRGYLVFTQALLP